MNINGTLVLISLLTLWLAAPCSADGRISLGASLISPNGRYSVHLEELGGVTYFVIKDTVTERLDHSIVMPTALLYLHWATDSKSFVTVEHIAKGSYGRVVYLDGDKWKNVEVRPPYDGMMDATVINLRLGMNSVYYKFAVRTLTPHWEPIDYRFCDVDVSLKTAKMFHVRWTPVAQEEWATSLWPRKPVYLPPMTDEIIRDER